MRWRHVIYNETLSRATTVLSSMTTRRESASRALDLGLADGWGRAGRARS
jgi:hypothetical protein